MSNIMAQTFEDAVAVTKSDATNDPAGPFCAFIAGSAGNVTVTTARGTKAVIPVLGGVVYNLAIKRVWATGTDPATVLGFLALPYAGGQQ